MRVYELMTIHRPELVEEDAKAAVAEIASFLGEKGADVKTTDLWGKRRFAYEIDHMNEGFYSVLTFSAEADVVDELDRMLSLSDQVIRHKVVRPGA